MQCRDFEYLQSIQSTFVREVDKKWIGLGFEVEERAYSFGCKKGLVGADCEWTIGTSGNIDHQCQNQSLLTGVQRTEINKKTIWRFRCANHCKSQQFGGPGVQIVAIVNNF